MTEHMNDMGLTYEQYMKLVDVYLVAALGVTHSDLADYLTYDAFIEDADPQETAYNIAEHDGIVPQDLLDRIYEVK